VPAPKSKDYTERTDPRRMTLQSLKEHIDSVLEAHPEAADAQVSVVLAYNDPQILAGKAVQISLATTSQGKQFYIWPSHAAQNDEDFHRLVKQMKERN
jgi:hypothetical protein